MSEEQDAEEVAMSDQVANTVDDIFGDDEEENQDEGAPSSGQQRSALALMEDDEDEDDFPVKGGKKRQRSEGGDGDAVDKDDDLLADSDDEKVAVSRMKARARKDEDDDEDDEDEDEDDDSDDDDERLKKKAKKDKKSKEKKDKKSKEKKEKKSRRYGVERFFDEEAEEDEDEEEVEEEAERAGEEVLREEQVEAERLIDQRHEMNRQRMNMSAQEMAAEYERKAQEERRRKQLSGSYIQGEGVLGRIKSNAVMQQSLLPTINDKIFRVRCATGKEQQLVRSILIKCIDSKARGMPLGVKSVFCTSTQGVIYIEAVAEPFAKEVIQKLYGIFHPTFKKVPVQEMTSLMTVTVKKKPLRVGQLVRMKRGVLKGDLVQIQDVLEGGSKVFVKAVPRPDYSRGGGAKGAVRPPQRLLNIEEARNSGGDCQRKRCPSDRSNATYDFWSNEYFKDGFMYKEVNVSTYIHSDDVKPRLEELQLFRLHDEKKKSYNQYDEEVSEEEDEEEDEEAGLKNTQSIVSELAKQLQEYGDDGKAAVPFVVGDLVQITGGELRNLVARITAVNEISRTAQVVPLSNALSLGGALSVEMGLLVKYIELGSHVKVCSGQYMGQTGRVVSVNMSGGSHMAAVLTDGVNSEIVCNISQLQISDEVATGKDNLNGYELYDLVQLNDNETGVVIYVGREKLRLLTHLDVTKEVLPLEIQAKRNFMSEKAQSYDSAQAVVSVGDVVSVATGGHMGSSGTVKHISKGHLFLHSNSHLKNSGMFVVRAKSCAAAGAKTQILALGPTQGQAAGGKKVSDILPSGRSNKLNQNAAVGKTIRILRGQYKGLLAQVIDATQSHYLVELLAKMKRVNIPIDITVIVGDKQGSIHGAASREPSTFLPATPSLGMDTPSYAGSETPSHMGSETPLYGAGDSTPQGLRTPAFQYMHDDDDDLLPASAAATYRDWVESVVVVIKAGPNSSRIAVIQQRPSSDGKIVVSVVGQDNRLEPGTLALHYSDLALHAVQKDMRVVVLAGPDRGLMGVHFGTSGGNVVVRTAEGRNNFYLRENCGALYQPVP